MDDEKQMITNDVLRGSLPTEETMVQVRSRTREVVEHEQLSRFLAPAKVEEWGDLDDDQIVGRNIARGREIRGLSQADLAAAMALSGHQFHQQTVLKIEKGRRPLRLSEAKQIAEILEVDLSALFWHPVKFDFAAGLEGLITKFEEHTHEVQEHAVRMLEYQDHIQWAMDLVRKDFEGEIGFERANAALKKDPESVVRAAVVSHELEKQQLDTRMDHSVRIDGPGTFFPPDHGTDDDPFAPKSEADT